MSTEEMTKKLRDMAAQILTPESKGKHLFNEVADRLEQGAQVQQSLDRVEDALRQQHELAQRLDGELAQLRADKEKAESELETLKGFLSGNKSDSKSVWDAYEERNQLQVQRDQVLHLLGGGTLTEAQVTESGLGVGVLSEQRHHEYMRTKAEKACAEMRGVLQRIADRVVEERNTRISREELGPTIIVLECALDFALGRTRVSFSGHQWGAEQVQAEIARLQKLTGMTGVQNGQKD